MLQFYMAYCIWTFDSMTSSDLPFMVIPQVCIAHISAHILFTNDCDLQNGGDFIGTQRVPYRKSSEKEKGIKT